MSEALQIRRFTGPQVAAYIPELARLRILVFRQFPYLYDGDTDYEQRYLRTYTASAASVVVLVFDGKRIVGASTGLPLTDETDNVIAPFREQGLDVERIFYFGESVLLPEYRGRGLGVRFFEEREDHARSLGRFDFTCFCAVERPADHPLRPEGYVPLDRFWENRGYARQPSLKTSFSWRDVGEDRETGYQRVRIGARARALENQIYVIQSPTVGEAPWSEAVDSNVGLAAVYTPVDIGFPDNGILAQGRRGGTGWVFADLDPRAIERVRNRGQVFNHRDWARHREACALPLTRVTP